MHKLGALGGFASMTPSEFGGSGRGLKHAIQVIEEVSKECVSTGFLVWAQYALQWYLVNSANTGLKSSILPKVAIGPNWVAPASPIP
jgi:alkylation response protein AidB-like acyl-CoA dehydrogenase